MNLCQRIYLDADIAIEHLEDKLSKGFYAAAKDYLKLDSVRSAISAAYGKRALEAYGQKLAQVCQ